MKKITLIVLLSVIYVLGISQEFLYRAKLPKVDSSGYYHIFLKPNVTSKLNYKFSDIRIFDKKNNEIPYVHLSEDEIYKTAKRSELPIKDNTHKIQKKFTNVLVQNINNRKINNLVLIADNPKNAEAWINVAGSNDLKNWNILKNNSRYMPEYSDSTTTQIRIDDLPESNFSYYRILIYDYDKTVFIVRKVLNFEIGKKNIEFVELPQPSFTQDDTTEANQSVIQITFDEPQYVDKITFSISFPPYFLRRAEITKKDSTSGKKIRLQLYDQNQKDFYLCSDSTNELLLSRYYAKNLFLIVYNNDDNPLKFSKIRAFQRKEYIVAYLEKNKDYHILFGNPNVPPPIYDLKFFKYKIPPKCPVVQTGKVVKLSDYEKQTKTIEVPPIYLWILFTIVVLVLSAISLKMFVFARKKE
jgi:hypothetical protein